MLLICRRSLLWRHERYLAKRSTSWRLGWSFEQFEPSNNENSIWKVNWHCLRCHPQPHVIPATGGPDCNPKNQNFCHHDKHTKACLNLDFKPIKLCDELNTNTQKMKIIELAFSLSRSFICCGWKGKTVAPDFCGIFLFMTSVLSSFGNWKSIGFVTFSFFDSLSRWRPQLI